MSGVKRVAGRMGATLALAVTMVGLSMGPAHAVTGPTWVAKGPVRLSSAAAQADLPSVSNQCTRNVSRPQEAAVVSVGDGKYQALVKCVKVRP